MVDWTGIVLATVASMVIGHIWYGPLFGKQWIKLMGFSAKEQKEMQKGGSKMAKAMLLMFVNCLVMAFVLSMFVAGGTVSSGVETAFWLWLGFVATLEFGGTIWANNPVNLFLLNAAFWLITLEAMAYIIIAF